MNAPKTAAVLALVLAACRAVPDTARFENSLRAEGVRSVAVDDRFVLYSPYEPARTQRYVTAANRALDDLQMGLGVEPGPSIIVVLLPRPVEGGVLSLSGDELTFERAPERPSDRDVLGIAGSRGDRDVAGIYVSADRTRELPDGRTITETFTFARDIETLRHELAHVVAERAGLVGGQWLDEGLAQLFEHGRLEDGELVTDWDAPSLVAARDRYARTTLNLLLAWEESHAAAVKGNVFHAGRPVAHALAVFAVEGAEGSVPERVRWLASLDDADVLALEPAFRTWLAAGMKSTEHIPEER